MSSFSIKPKQAEKIAEDEGSLVRELASIELRISSAKSGIQLGSATSRIRNRLGVLASDVNDERRAMDEMKKGLENVNSSYVRTENKLSGKASQVTKPSVTSLVSAAAGIAMMPQGAVSAILFFQKADSMFKNLWTVLFPDWATGENHLFTDWLQYKLGQFGFQAEDNDELAKWSKDIDLLDDLKDFKLKNDSIWKKTADKLKEFNDQHDYTGKKGYYDKDGNYHDVRDLDDGTDEKKKFDDASSLEKAVTIASAGTKVSGSLWETSGGAEDEEFSEGGVHGSYEVSAGKAEAEASAYAGLYSYSADGTKHFTPGFGAEVGVGVTAFSASAKGQIGDEYFNVHGNASFEAGKAEASAAVNVGLFDADGKLNPQAGVSLSAEALLAEAKGTVGGTIAGTSVEATGSVNFGVGAHADIGLVDGHLSVDIGASLGVGVGVKLDIDMSGTIQAVADTVGAVADTASNAWAAFTGWFH